MPRMTLEPLVAKRLIALLASDDSFRTRFITDTGAALASVGHVPEDPAELDAFLRLCFNDVKLASREEISGAQAEIFSMLTIGTAFNVPMMEAGNHVRALKDVVNSSSKAA